MKPTGYLAAALGAANFTAAASLLMPGYGHVWPITVTVVQGLLFTLVLCNIPEID